MEDRINLKAGKFPVCTKRAPFFQEERIRFLASLSERLLKSKDIIGPEVTALGFWLRASHLYGLRKKYDFGPLRRGRGLAFHIVPSNVPTMFVYSFALSFLAGNSNIVRLSRRIGETGDYLCSVIRQLFLMPEFSELEKYNAFLFYDHDQSITEELLSKADLRIFWGGDQTIRSFEHIPSRIDAKTICFPDRRSIAVFSQAKVCKMTSEEIHFLCRFFYNDSFVFDQNACSSPKDVFWLNDGGERSGRARFWSYLAEIASREYSIDAYRAMRKYETAVDMLMDDMNENNPELRKYGGNLLYVVSNEKITEKSIAACRRRSLLFGMFVEWSMDSLNEITKAIDRKTQTITYVGIDPKELGKILLTEEGVDRIVPVGQALEMDPIWDGFDLPVEMSRILDIR